LALEGSYDWFYEGFTIYQAARTAVRLGLLTFPEFLSSLGRAYDAYVGGVDHDRWSLVEASQRRWTGGESVVYQKSMLVAFLYDLKLRSQSNGKRSLNDIYRELFRQNRAVADEPRITASGNEAVLKVLAGLKGMEPFAESYVSRAVTINLPSELMTFGLRVERPGSRSQLSVDDRLSRRQRDLLHDLGYNDTARSGPRK
jgi:predicted metalloprotease with PDZ domain